MCADFAYGVDIVSIARMRKALDRSGERFVRRIFAGDELAFADDPGFLATRFAAKEAFFKALGTGVSGGVRWHDFVLPPDHGGISCPAVGGRSADYLDGRTVLASVSRTSEIAVAVVFLEGSGDRK